MYAIIQSGGKQYPVQVGQSLRLEKLPAEVGQSIDIDKVLLIKDDNGCQVGTPLLSGAKVMAEVETHGRAKKINILKFKRRKHHMKHMGHRQHYTQVKITAIHPAGGAAKAQKAQVKTTAGAKTEEAVTTTSNED